MWLVVGLAWAADTSTLGQVVKVRGATVISQGGMYTLGQEGTNLKPGNRLMTLEGAMAVLQFSDNCQYRMGEDQLLDVGPQSPCAMGQGGDYRPDPKSAVQEAANPVVLQPAAHGEIPAAHKDLDTRQDMLALTGIGTLEEVKGSVRINGREVRSGAQLHLRNPLETGAGGEAKLKFTDGQVIFLRPSSKFIITDYHYLTQRPGNNRASFELLKGSLFYRAGAMAKEDPHAVKLVTPSGTLDINAADFTVIIGSMVLQVAQGSVTLDGLEIQAGQYLFVPEVGQPLVFNSLEELLAALPSDVLAQASTLSSSVTLAGGGTITLVAGIGTQVVLGAITTAILTAALNEVTHGNEPISVQP